MPVTSVPSVHDLRAQFETVLASVTTAEAQTMSADRMERHLLSQLLALGRALFALFLATRAAATRAAVDRDPAGVERPYTSERTRGYLSIFGRLEFARPYFYRKGAGGAAPVDALLSLPPTVCADLVRETAEELGVGEAYHKGLGVLRRLLGLELSTRTLAEQVGEDAPEVEAFYAQQAPPPPTEEAAILVVQADGKGVPILRRPRPDTPAPVRLGKGQKQGGKKEAALTATCTSAPAVRTPEAVVDSLFADAPATGTAPTAPARTGPQHKRLWATLAGKDTALAEAAGRVAVRAGAHIAHRVALTDGSQALQERVQRQLPAFTLVLDLIHATEYLWKAANAVLGETAPRRTGWVKVRTLQLLRSQGTALVADLRQLADTPGRPRHAHQSRRLPGAQRALHGLCRLPRARLAHRHRRDRGCLPPPGQGSLRALGHALDHRRRRGPPASALRAGEWRLGRLSCLPSSPAPPPALRRALPRRRGDPTRPLCAGPMRCCTARPRRVRRLSTQMKRTRYIYAHCAPRSGPAAYRFRCGPRSERSAAPRRSEAVAAWCQ